MDLLEKNPLKLYFTISEVADAFGISSSLLRYWEREFPSLKPKKSPRGDRLYARRNVEQVQMIYNLVKEKGFTLKGARQEMEARQAYEKEKEQIIQTLMKVRRGLVQLHNQLGNN